MKNRIALLAIALVMASIGWYGLTKKPANGAVCLQPGKVAAASDGSVLACQDGVAWKQSR